MKGAAAAALAFALATACTTSGDAATDARRFLDHYVATLESRDETQVRDLFVDDGRFVWFTDGAKSYASAAEVVAGMRRFADVRFRTELHEVHVLPLTNELVSVHSGFRTRLELSGGGEHLGGVIRWLLERSPADGRWRVLLGHTSTPGGPPRS